ncbi:29 kDa ribonucleoprotein A, chloroplastic [Cocos nucifera]|uniref:29 kDa ribonucleoprotein A, chloroplastic n=1 Tax=Cocos nucifera TaxID=13894 RepID=A0A8K0HYT4_COCNU|nr:29 kDa ribonucleoprotein A, chloroplastic [Cocos nucifera]
MAVSSLLPSLSTKIPSISSKPKTPTLAFSFSSPKPFPSVKPLSLFSFSSYPSALRLNARPFGSGIVRNVAVSSEIEPEEELASGGEVANFSPDLKLFVGNLPFSIDSAQLAGLFQSAGNVEMVEVIYDKLTGRSRGFGFVTMSTVEEVEAAVQQFNGYTLEGRALRVNSGPPPPKDELSSKGFRTGGSFDASNRVYVGNLAWGVDNLALETLFSEQGKVMEAKVVYDRETGRSRGFGFVTYSNAEEVNNAIASLNGVVSNLHSLFAAS